MRLEHGQQSLNVTVCEDCEEQIMKAIAQGVGGAEGREGLARFYRARDERRRKLIGLARGDA